MQPQQMQVANEPRCDLPLMKRLDKAATTAWCPSAKHRHLIASGTTSGTFDEQLFQNSCTLEIYDTNLAGQGQEMTHRGSVTCKNTFTKVAWGTKGMDVPSGPNGLGLIAGGMSDGTVNIWSASGILANDPNSLVVRTEHHKGFVLGLEFHPQQPNLMASGGADGEILIWDLAKPSTPTVSKPHNRGTAGGAGISTLGWNKRVAHILATSSETGETNVWDLRQQRAVLTFRCDGMPQCRSNDVAWNPSVAVQIAVAYGNPVPEIWDLRRSMAPAYKLPGGHSSGVRGLAWNTIDSNIMLSSGDDARFVAWNMAKDPAIVGIYQNDAPAVSVDWNPHTPSMFCSSNKDSSVTLRSLQTVRDYVPNWHIRPAGASFAFGGRVLSFWNKTAPSSAPTAAGAPVAAAAPSVRVTQLPRNVDLLQRAGQFQSTVDSGDYRALCQAKAAAAQTDAERDQWSYMSLLFLSGDAQRNALLSKLGYAPPESKTATETDASGPDDAAPAPALADTPLDAGNADDFFDNFDEPAEATDAPTEAVEPSSTTGPAAALADLSLQDDDNKNLVPESTSIKRALILGDFATAVDECMAAGRLADALMIASCASDETLWQKTQQAYFTKTKSQFLRNVLRSVANHDLVSLVRDGNLDQWKQTLALLISYARGGEFSELAAALAHRLLTEANDADSAALVHVCASNVDGAARLWTDATAAEQETWTTLQDAVEKISVFSNAVVQQQPQHSQTVPAVVHKKFCEYATLLVEEGGSDEAFRFLSAVSGSVRPEDDINVLRYRIWSTAPNQSPPPPHPFDPAERVRQEKIALQQRQQREQAEHMRQQQQQQQMRMQQQQGQHTQHQQQWAASQRAPPNQMTAQRSPAPRGIAPQPNYGGRPQHPSQPPVQPHGAPAPAPGQFSPAPVQQQRPVAQPMQPQQYQASPAMQPRSADNKFNPSPAHTQAPAPGVSNAPAADASGAGLDLAACGNVVNQLADEVSKLAQRQIEQKKLTAATKKLQVLHDKIAAGDFSAEAQAQLASMCTAVKQRNFSRAQAVHTKFCTDHWDEHGKWLPGLKSLMQLGRRLIA
jgi:protein transport protein SEC31